MAEDIDVEGEGNEPSQALLLAGWCRMAVGQWKTSVLHLERAQTERKVGDWYLHGSSSSVPSVAVIPFRWGPLQARLESCPGAAGRRLAVGVQEVRGLSAKPPGADLSSSLERSSPGSTELELTSLVCHTCWSVTFGMSLTSSHLIG